MKTGFRSPWGEGGSFCDPRTLCGPQPMPPSVPVPRGSRFPPSWESEHWVAVVPLGAGLGFYSVSFTGLWCSLLTLRTTRYIFSIYAHVERAVAPHSSTLAWKIPWKEEPGRLQSMGSRRVEHDWATSLSLFTFMHWRRQWQPTPVFSPRESQGWQSLMGCRLWGRTELDTTEAT